LNTVCNRRDYIYGTSGSERRRQVQNKVNKWKGLGQAEYTLLLASLGVRSVPVVNTTPPTERSSSPPSQQRHPKTQPTPTRGDPTAARSCGDPTNPTVRSMMTTRNLFPAPEDVDYGKRRVVLSPVAFLLFFLTSLLLVVPPPPEIIDVNIERPECNREVTVFHLNSVDIDGALYDGYEITVDGDMRDVIADKYKAWLRSHNEVVVQIPSIGTVFLNNAAFFNERMKEAKVHCARTQESHDVARNKILKDEKRQTKRLLLRFPSDKELSNTVYSPKSLGGEIELQVVPIKTEFIIDAGDASDTTRKHKFMTTIARVSWKIAVIGKETRETKPSGNKGAAKLLEQLSSMQIS
jgi:hypothetical protein